MSTKDIAWMSDKKRMSHISQNIIKYIIQEI